MGQGERQKTNSGGFEVGINDGNGYVKEYHMERLIREAKVIRIYESTSEIQKIVISRTLLR